MLAITVHNQNASRLDLACSLGSSPTTTTLPHCPSTVTQTEQEDPAALLCHTVCGTSVGILSQRTYHCATLCVVPVWESWVSVLTTAPHCVWYQCGNLESAYLPLCHTVCGTSVGILSQRTYHCATLCVVPVWESWVSVLTTVPHSECFVAGNEGKVNTSLWTRIQGGWILVWNCILLSGVPVWRLLKIILWQHLLLKVVQCDIIYCWIVVVWHHLLLNSSPVWHHLLLNSSSVASSTVE